MGSRDWPSILDLGSMLGPALVLHPPLPDWGTPCLCIQARQLNINAVIAAMLQQHHGTGISLSETNGMNSTGRTKACAQHQVFRKGGRERQFHAFVQNST